MIGFLHFSKQYLLLVFFLHLFWGYFVSSNDGMFSYEEHCLETENTASKVSLAVFHKVVSLKVYLGSGAYNIGQSVLVSS